MKRILNFVLIMFTVVLCTGCVQSTYDISIDKRNNVTIKENDMFNYLPLQNVQFREKVFEELVAYYQQNITDNGEFVPSASANGNADITITKNAEFTKAPKILPSGFTAKEGETAFSMERGLLKSKYKIHLLYNQNKALLYIQDETSKFQKSSTTFSQYNNYLSRMVISKEIDTTTVPGTKFIKTTYADGNVVLSRYSDNLSQQNNKIVPQAVLRIKTPKKASKHNAHTVISPTEYEWNLSGGDMSVAIILEYEYLDLRVLILVISILVLVGGGILLSKKLQNEPPVQGL